MMIDLCLFLETSQYKMFRLTSKIPYKDKSTAPCRSFRRMDECSFMLLAFSSKYCNSVFNSIYKIGGLVKNEKWSFLIKIYIKIIIIE